MTDSEAEKNEREYRTRYPLLQQLATTLQHEATALLAGLPHIDRTYFRAKAPGSFAKKSVDLDEQGQPKYLSAFEDIEDQVAGRVLVFFRRDLDIVVAKLREGFNRVEQKRKEPSRQDAFAYESMHLVMIIPPHLLPTGWGTIDKPPTTFEMQVRTLFMHAWAEPEHEISYKGSVRLNRDEQRRLAWAASSAWGGDEIFEHVLDSMARRSDGQNDP